MPKVFVTGDTHGILELAKIIDWYNQNEINGIYFTKEDCLIILGDFGLIWHNKHSDAGYFRDEYILDELNDMPFTVLFIDGNHENFDRLGKYKTEKWHDGKVSFIRDSVIYLHRGQIFTIAGHKFLTMGGATSLDKDLRTVGKSWWKQENISSKDIDEALNNLAQVNNDVDYVLSHAAPADFARQVIENLGDKYSIDFNEYHLQDIKTRITYLKWYCGHYHHEYCYGKFCSLYNNIIPVDTLQRYGIDILPQLK